MLLIFVDSWLGSLVHWTQILVLIFWLLLFFHRMRDHGRKVFLVTNSGYSYTEVGSKRDLTKHEKQYSFINLYSGLISLGLHVIGILVLSAAMVRKGLTIQDFTISFYIICF